MRQFARAYILVLLDIELFVDKSGNTFFTVVVTQFFKEAGSFSWGSTILVCLYNELCRATSPILTRLLVPWFFYNLWEHIHVGHPERLMPWRGRHVTTVDLPPDLVQVGGKHPVRGFETCCTWWCFTKANWIECNHTNSSGPYSVGEGCKFGRV